MNSERGELVRGSDPPLVYSARSTAGGLWRAQIKLVLKTHLVIGVQKSEAKTSVSQRDENIILRRFDERPQENTSNLSRPKAWIEMRSLTLSPTLV